MADGNIPDCEPKKGMVESLNCQVKKDGCEMKNLAGASQYTPIDTGQSNSVTNLSENGIASTSKSNKSDSKPLGLMSLNDNKVPTHIYILNYAAKSETFFL